MKTCSVHYLKVTQMVAKVLKIPLDMIKVKTTNTITGNNAGSTGGSFTAELLCRVSIGRAR